jgi:hypothetical protein
MQAAVTKQWIIKSLMATIEAIFTVCGVPDIDVQQYPLLLENWFDLNLGWHQNILGLVIDLNRPQASLQTIELQMAPKQKIL